MVEAQHRSRSTAPDETSRPSADDARAAPRERSAWHDNVRFVGICLVVAGHWGVGRYAYPTMSTVVGQMIYSFHMALFVMLAGRFSKPGGSLGVVFRRSWGQLILPLALFATLNSVLLKQITGKSSGLSSMSIPFGLWFLLALFCWRLMVVPLGRWRVLNVLAWPLAIVGLLLSGLTPNAFSLTRTLAFFPAFLFGMTVLPRIETALRRPAVRCLAAVTVVAGMSLVAVQTDRIPSGWMTHATTYADLGNEFLRGAAIRAALMAFGIVMSVGVMSLVSARNLGAVSRMGRYTLYAYLLHLPVTQVIRYWLMPTTDFNPTVAMAVTLAIVPFTIVAMSAPVRRLIQPMVEPMEFVRPRTSPNQGA